MFGVCRIIEFFLLLIFQVICWALRKPFMTTFIVVGIVSIVYSLLTLVLLNLGPPIIVVVAEVLLFGAWLSSSLVTGLMGFSSSLGKGLVSVIIGISSLCAFAHLAYSVWLIYNMIQIKNKQLIEKGQGFTTRGLLRRACINYKVSPRMKSSRNPTHPPVNNGRAYAGWGGAFDFGGGVGF